MFSTSLSVLSVSYVTAQRTQPLKGNAYLIHLLFARIKKQVLQLDFITILQCSFHIRAVRLLILLTTQKHDTFGWNMISTIFLNGDYLFGHLQYLLSGKGSCVEFNLSPSLLTCITPVCLKLALGWTSRGRATLSWNTWFHKPVLSQQADSATEVLVDLWWHRAWWVVTTFNAKAPAGISSARPDAGTRLYTKRVPEVRRGNVACLSKATVFVESGRVDITHEEQCGH